MCPHPVPVYRGAVHCVSGVRWVKTIGRLLAFVCYCERCTDDSALSERDARQRDFKYARGYDRDGMEPLDLLLGKAPSEGHVRRIKYEKNAIQRSVSRTRTFGA